MGRPIIVTATLIAFVFGWNNFLWPLIVTDSPDKTVLTVGTGQPAVATTSSTGTSCWPDRWSPSSRCW